MITAPRIGWFQADLVSFEGLYRVKKNKPYKFLLTIMDIYSRKGWGYKLRDKRPETVVEKIKEFLNDVKKAGHSVLNFQTDRGSEFKGSVRELMKDKEIHHRMVDTADHNTQGIIERWNQTLRRLISDMFVENDDFVWVDGIGGIIEEYNERRHSSTGSVPNKVWKGLESAYVFRKDVPELLPGDAVRVLVKKELFEKKSQTQNFTKRVYEVERKDGLKYRLVGEDGRYARWELLKSKFPVSKDTAKGREPIGILREIRKENSIEKELKRNDIDDANILERVSKAKKRPEKQATVPREDKKTFDVEEEDVFIAEKIVKQRKRKGKVEYLVRWKGYGEEDDTWEVAKNLPTILLKEWREERKGKGRVKIELKGGGFSYLFR